MRCLRGCCALYHGARLECGSRLVLELAVRSLRALVIIMLLSQKLDKNPRGADAVCLCAIASLVDPGVA